MGNDDKVTSREDDSPMDSESESHFLPEDSADSSALFEPEKKAKSAGEKNSKTVAFPKPASPRLGASLEASFGMPDFDFLENPPGEPEESPKKPDEKEPPLKSENKEPAFKSNLEQPLSKDTGWEKVETIGRSNAAETKEDETAAAPVPQEDVPAPKAANAEPAEKRSQATVMPFPRNNFPRIVSDESSAEVTPLDLLRGAESELDALNNAPSPSRTHEEHEGAPDFDAAAQDTLADAVQSALRNVYGARNSEPEDGEAPDLGGFTVADSLIGAPQLDQSPSWHQEEDSHDWQTDKQGYVDDEQEAAALAVDTESVLDRFYSHRGEEQSDVPDRQNTVLSGELSLRDYSEASGRPNEDWQDDDSDYEDRSGGFHHTEPGFGAPYRGDMAPHAREADDGRNMRFVREPGDLFPGVSYSSEPAIPPNAAPNPEVEWRKQAAAASAYHAPPLHSHAPTAPYYPGHLPATAPEHLASTGPDSGHLLGAAGLGLIGGIALAGVLAVFVFNSFVEEDGTSRVASSAKVVERLGNNEAAQTEAGVTNSDVQAIVRQVQPRPELQATPSELETPPQQAATAPARIEPPRAEPAPRVAAVQEPATTPDLAPPAPIATGIAEPIASADQKLIARPIVGPSDQALDVEITITNPADAEDALVSLKGLPAEGKLSTGIDVGGGQWLLPPARLKDLTVNVPQSAEGEHELEVQLLKDDAQTSSSDPLIFPMTIGDVQTAAPALSADAEEASRAARLAPLPDETPQLDTDFLTQTLIRDGNRMMRDGDIVGARRLYEQAAVNGNPEAALAMGRSFDPSYFEKLPVKTGKPDPAVAFDWYKKALEGGLVTARVKIDALKQWLQR